MFSIILFIMPRVESTICDRVYILKLISTVQMTFASFTAILFLYLIVLQFWSSQREERSDIFLYKGISLILNIWNFGMGTILAFAANTRGIVCRRLLTLYTILEALLIPVGIYFFMRLYYRVIKSKQKHRIDPHCARLCLVQACFFLCHFVFIAYVLDFLTLKRRPKFYDPSIRPKNVEAPTDPEITTTESRHIRISSSFLYQSSSSRAANTSTFQSSTETVAKEIV